MTAPTLWPAPRPSDSRGPEHPLGWISDNGSSSWIETSRRIRGRVDLTPRPPEQKRCGKGRGGGRGLDAEPALPRAPEEAAPRAAIAIDRQPVGREAAEARPFVLDRDNPPVDDLLQPVDRDRDVQLVRRSVAGIAGRLVMRA